MTSSPPIADLGFGLGLRPKHYEALLGEHAGAVDWLEAITENYLGLGGKPLHYLERLREKYPIVLHGVSLSIGSTDALDERYLRHLRAFADWLEPAWISDHLCWTGVGGVNLHDLLPLPYTEEALAHVADRILRVQELLGRRILIENVSSYVAFPQSEMREHEFLSELAVRSDCFVLLDVNNVYVSSVNHGFDPREYIAALPANRIAQIHLAGHSRQGKYLIDTHDAPVSEPVWALYRDTVARFGSVPTMIERDANIPALDELLVELDRARTITREVLVDAA